MAYLDALRKPSLTHVSSMTRNPFFYLLIKTMVLAVWIGLPGAALWFAATRFFGTRLTLHGVLWTRLMWIACAVAVGTATLALGFAAWHELKYVSGAESPIRRHPPKEAAKLVKTTATHEAASPEEADASAAETV